jgi:hypothetical protein
LALTLGLGPIAMTIVMCMCGVQVFHSRYFVFSQPFLLSAVAMTVVRLRPPALAVFAQVWVIVASYWVCADGWTALQLAERPGYRGTAEYVQSMRQPGEPVVVARGWLYLPFHYHSADRSGLHVYPAPAGKWVEGQNLLQAAELLQPQDMTTWTGRVWVVNLRGFLEVDRGTVPVPAKWQEIDRRLFLEGFNRWAAEVIEYEASP